MIAIIVLLFRIPCCQRLLAEDFNQMGSAETITNVDEQLDAFILKYFLSNSLITIKLISLDYTKADLPNNLSANFWNNVPKSFLYYYFCTKDFSNIIATEIYSGVWKTSKTTVAPGLLAVFLKVVGQWAY